MVLDNFFRFFRHFVGYIFVLLGSYSRNTVSHLRLATLILVFAWCGSLSVGANTPGNVSGLGALAIMLYIRDTKLLESRALLAVCLSILTLTPLAFIHGRTTHIYREKDITCLSGSLDYILPGGRLIYTNPQTFDYLSDLRRVTDSFRSSSRKYAILPDTPGWWVKSEQRNPLPIDWAQNIELNRKCLKDRVIRSLERKRGKLTVLVQKADARLLPEGIVSESYEGWSVPADYVMENFNKIGETNYFLMYQ